MAFWSGGELHGQLSIYDVAPDVELKPRPCDYRFRRYIGQRVRNVGKYHADYKGVIIGIEPFYTIVKTDNGREIAATPYDLGEEAGNGQV